MSEQILNEIWQVEVGGQIYEAPFSELGVWIGEGSLLPQDRVRKGNLRWIEACRVPNLIPFFNAKEKGLPIPVVVNTTDAGAPAQLETEPHPETINSTHHDTASDSATMPENVPSTEQLAPDISDRIACVDPKFCAVHSGVPSEFVCDGCLNGFCRSCPKTYGGSVKICPYCGAMCRSLADIKRSRSSAAIHADAATEGFGANDFFNALAHPFRFKPSLLFGGLMFMFFTMGREASAIGGIFMIVGAIFSGLSANALTFGVLANTVQNFSQGHLDLNFMPEFDDFSLWDDVIHPFFLSIGAYLVSFGPFFGVLVIGFFIISNSVNSHLDAYQRDLEKLPGTQYYAGRETVEQSEDVRKVLDRVNEDNDNLLATQEQIAAGNKNVVVDEESGKQEELWEMAQQSRMAQLESVVGPSPEEREIEAHAAMQAFLNLSPPVVIIGAIFFLWGAMYFPVACAIAGYTRSFSATINPTVGLDTIKHLGSTYAKILLMALALVIASAIFTGLLGAVLSPFDMPGIGNLPVTAIGALFTFYVSVVFSCVLGYAMFKKADKLGLSR